MNVKFQELPVADYFQHFIIYKHIIEVTLKLCSCLFNRTDLNNCNSLNW